MNTGILRVKLEGGTAPSFNCRGLAFDLAFTALLIALLIGGAIYLLPLIAPKSQRPLGAVVIVAIYPVVTLVLLSLIERLLPPAGPRKSLRSWFLHLHINILYVFMVGIAGTLAIVASSALARTFGFDLGLIDLRFADGRFADGKGKGLGLIGLIVLIGAVWLAAVAGDFFFYWFHRALHKVPFLWAHHKLHHMDPELEAITVTRQNWIEAFLAALFISMPMAIVFRVDTGDPWELGVVGGVVATVVVTLLTLSHMNVRFQVGKASLFYCSPQIHRIHHSCLSQHQDKNFAFILPLWDVLFGTYYAPNRDEFPLTGVEGEKEIQSFWEAQIFTQREWWRMFRAWHRRRDSSPA